MNPHTFIFMGRSGCGKGTQAELLKKFLTEKNSEIPVFHLESGAKFRDFIAQDGEVNELSRAGMKTGALQPEFLAVWVWAELLIEGFKKDGHLIVDGTPRKVHEAQVFDGAMQFLDRKNPYYIFINVSREWARERLMARKRADDDAKDIEARLDWYDTHVVPTVDFFRKNPHYQFVEINGEQSIELVQAEILSKLNIS